MYQMKHREDLEDVMESFGVIVKEATYEGRWIGNY